MRVALSVIAALVVVGAFVALRGGEVAADRPRDARDGAHEAPRTEADVVLASTEVPRGVTAAESSAVHDDVWRASPALEASDVRWRDVLQPVDALTGFDLRGAHVAHTRGVEHASGGEVPAAHWRAIDDALAVADHESPGHVVVAVDGYMAALVDLALALGATERPVRVALHPRAEVMVEIVASGIGTSVSDVTSITVRRSPHVGHDHRALGLQPPQWAPPLPGFFFAEGVDGDFRPRADEIVVGGAFDRTTGIFETGRDHVWQAAVLYARLATQYPPYTDEGRALRADDAPTFARRIEQHVHGELHAATLFTGLPAGVRLELDVRGRGHSLIESRVPLEVTEATAIDFQLMPGERRWITVRLLGSAGLIGALPTDASTGAVELAWRSAGGTWIYCKSKRELRGGEFRFDDLRPGAWRCDATWRDERGAHVRVTRSFEVAAGAIHDLGVLAPNDGVDVTIVPRVEIDGVLDETLLGGALLATSWRIDHSGASLDGTLESARCARLEPLVLRGIVGDEFVVSFDRPELPSPAAESLRFVEWRCATRHALDGPLTLEATLCLASSVLVQIQFDCKRSDIDISPIARVRALARRLGTDDVREIEGGSALLYFDGRYLRARVGLDLGTWDVYAAVGTQTPYEETDGEVSLFGSTRINVVPGVIARIELAPAATVIFGPNFDWRGDEPAGWFQVVPADQPDALAPLAYPWPGDGVTHDAAVDGLAPDTEYRVVGSAVRFRTGASGSRTLLE